MNYLFWTLCALMVVIALIFIALPLWRTVIRNNAVLRDAANLEIIRDQMSEMDADIRNGLLTQELYEQGKGELQARLAKEVGTSTQETTSPNKNKSMAVVLAVLLPLFCVPLYLYLGNQYAALPIGEKIEADNTGIISSEAGIMALEKQLRRHGDNPNSWFMLANSYVSIQKYPEALKAYEELVKRAPDEAQIWASYADVYGMANGRTLKSDVVAGFLEKSLALDPNNTSALALAGSAAMERENYIEAITHWQKLLLEVPPGSPVATRFNGSIQSALDLLAAQPDGAEKLAELEQRQMQAEMDLRAERLAASNPAYAVTGKVSLSPSLEGKVKPTDIVFILARASEGPRMPLAVFRKQVKDLPLEFTLDDSMAMQPQLKLSGFNQVVVVARISKSGSPFAQTGDLEGLSEAIKPGTKGLNVMINTVVQ
ncbi:MAG: c-type cytochrome biogenesis protein CcmI [Gallionella sp.]